ncbi:excisionase family DNA-binding protein [Marinobacterium sp. xm-a-152]|uniref:excisionase family DNA-binding protein n=1 Tax=Marinobacterium sp. xm-a-152 TaxID=2497733 RepID=UPI00156993A0|nr:excisionase family DNA-binding protein [Marinobacterium sp. xm-a-152]
MRTEREMASLLNPEDAANILNVSIPYVIRLLEEGEIAHHMVNNQCCIRLDDLMAYKRQQDLRSSQALDDLAQQAQELGIA